MRMNEVKNYTQEVQVDQTLPIGRIGNPESMDHPKDHSLFGRLDSQGTSFGGFDSWYEGIIFMS